MTSFIAEMDPNQLGMWLTFAVILVALVMSSSG